MLSLWAVCPNKSTYWRLLTLAKKMTQTSNIDKYVEKFKYMKYVCVCMYAAGRELLLSANSIIWQIDKLANFDKYLM